MEAFIEPMGTPPRVIQGQGFGGKVEIVDQEEDEERTDDSQHIYREFDGC